MSSIKVAILLDSFFIPAWAYEAITQVIDSPDKVICLIVNTNRQINPQPAYSSTGFLRKVNQYIYALYESFDQRIYRAKYLNSTNNAFIEKDIRQLLPHVPQIIMKNNDLASSIEEALRDTEDQLSKPDVIFQIGTKVAPKELIRQAKYGLWYVIHHHPDKGRSGGPGFWETYYNEGIIYAALLSLTASCETPQTLLQIATPTSEFNSMILTFNQVAWDSSAMLAIILKKLRIQQTLSYIQPNSLRQFTHCYPMFIYSALIFPKLFFRYIHVRFFQQHWIIQLADSLSQFSEEAISQSKFVKLLPPQNTFWADPFLIEYKQKTYLFFEEFNYQTQKGVIKVAPIIDSRFQIEPELALEQPFHLSNPLVFEEQGDFFLLPEQAESNEITLYKCHEFPTKWQKFLTILAGGYYIDPILFKHEEIWWLFVTNRMVNSGSVTVYGQLFFANSLTGSWQEHPMSPISTDCRYSRAAGKILLKNSKIYRVVQDSSKGYGYQIHLFEIKTLTPSLYHEELAFSLSPTSFHADGIHTLNLANHFMVIDSRQSVSKSLLKKPTSRRDDD